VTRDLTALVTFGDRSQALPSLGAKYFLP
jgi:hypothetical protein